jgi:indolepyruvate ferredoxin oxidoreductase
MSGVQALVRLPMLQRTRDAIEGLNTAGFVSGYRGSPLGGYDQALWAAKKHLAAQNIVFQPGVNEELGATAVWGTQQLDLYPQSKKFDGVFGIWYGKGPGVDRCSDVFKHANMAGTAKHGGVIAIAGDDHVSKSSTAAHQSDHIFKACGLPVFFPSNVQDILDMGLHAFAMSRFSGVWSGMKTIQEVVESSSSILVDPDRVKIIIPEDFEMPPGGLHIRWPDAPLEQEARLMDYKWYAALAYIRANKLNYNVIAGPKDRFGLIASGKAFNDTRQALADLGLDEDTCHQLGIRLHKVNVVWPLEATITRDFAEGLQEILVVEEKRQVIEYQIKEELYNWRADVRPNVLGKFDEPEGDVGRRMGPLQPERQLAAARQGRPDAGHHRQGDRQTPEKAGRAGRHHRAWTSAWPSSKGASAPWPKARPTPASARPGSAAAARTTPARACPKARAPWPASAATTWRPGWTAPPPPSPRWAAKA